MLADNNIIPPEEWYHDPKLRNKADETVAIILINKKILPPKNMEHIINYQEIYESSK